MPWLLSVFLLTSAHAVDLTNSTRLLVLEGLQRIPGETNPTYLPSKHPFGELARGFESAKGFEVKNVRGWYSGRCYFRDRPTKAIASLLAVDDASDKKEHGPAFKGSEFRKLTPFIRLVVASDYFDAMTEAKRSEVQKALARDRDENAYPVRSNDTLVVHGLRSIDLESRVYRYRRKGQEIYLELGCAERSYCMNRTGLAPTNRVLVFEGEATAYCYYFQRPKQPGLPQDGRRPKL